MESGILSKRSKESKVISEERTAAVRGCQQDRRHCLPGRLTHLLTPTRSETKFWDRQIASFTLLVV